MENKKKILIIIIIVLIGFIVGIMIYRYNTRKLYVKTCINDAWGKQEYGYIIYRDGTIEKFDKINNKSELKKEKLNDKELNELKNLAVSVEEKMKSVESDNVTYMELADGGYYKAEIYNSRLMKWIYIHKGSGVYTDNKDNVTEEGKRIQELIEEIEEKYIY